MSLRLRRVAVVAAILASLFVGVASIQVAGSLAAAAAPPTAPPISMTTLKTQLEAEQARSGALQEQLDALLAVSSSLSEALNSTSDQVSTDGLTADQLKERLLAAQDKLATVSSLLAAAQQRLTAIQGAAGGSGSTTTGAATGGTNGATGSVAAPAPGGTTASSPTAPPTPPPASFSIALVSGGVSVSWATCTASGFWRYAVVRSLDAEIHYPTEDLDTLAALIDAQGTTSYLDPVSAGTYWYRVYCLTNGGGEVRAASQTGTLKITVP